MDKSEAHQIFSAWNDKYWSRAVLVNADYAPEDEAENWVDELLNGALKALSASGINVERGPLRVIDDKIYVCVDGHDLLARDLAGGSPDAAITHILGRLDAIAATRDHAARWHVWYTGDPVGAAFFVTAEELVTSAGIDVRQLNTGEQWYAISFPSP